MIAKVSYSFPHLVEGFVEVELSLARVRHASQRGRDERGVHQPEPRSLGRDGEGAMDLQPGQRRRLRSQLSKVVAQMKHLESFFCIFCRWISF